MAPKALNLTAPPTDLVFGLLEAAATTGARCPTNAAICDVLQAQGVMIAAGTVPGIISALAKERRIEVRLYGHNWREVVIQSGPRAGQATQGPPGGGCPWRVIGG